MSPGCFTAQSVPHSHLLLCDQPNTPLSQWFVVGYAHADCSGSLVEIHREPVVTGDAGQLQVTLRRSATFKNACEGANITLFVTKIRCGNAERLQQASYTSQMNARTPSLKMR